MLNRFVVALGCAAICGVVQDAALQSWRVVYDPSTTFSGVSRSSAWLLIGLMAVALALTLFGGFGGAVVAGGIVANELLKTWGVVDYIHLAGWYFNLADVLIVGGALAVVLSLWRRIRDNNKSNAKESTYWKLRGTKWHPEPNSASTTASAHQRKPPTSNGAT